jgi:hypothetical protein
MSTACRRCAVLLHSAKTPLTRVGIFFEDGLQKNSIYDYNIWHQWCSDLTSCHGSSIDGKLISKWVTIFV